MKGNKRIKSIENVTVSVMIKNDSSGKESDVQFNKIIDNIISIVSLLEIAAVSETISPSNYFIVTRELEIVLNTIQDKNKDKKTLGATITADFFNVAIKDKLYTDKDRQKDSFVKDNMAVSIADQSSGAAAGVSSGRISDHMEVSSVNNVLRTDERLKKERLVMSFFASGRKLTVNELHRLVPQYGEKTVQRELIRLVNVGRLTKEGKKRWTRYFYVVDK